MKKYKRIIASILAIVTLASVSCLTLTGCGSDDGTTITTTGPLTQEVVEVVSIETPYGALEINERDKDDIIVEKKDEGDVYIVEFSTKIGEEEVLLFDAQFGKGSGDYVGTVKKDKEKVNAYLNFYDFEIGKFTEEQATKICALQESINEVSDSIEANPTFEK